MIEEKRIREKYGLSQLDMALYLDVSLSLLKLVETGARSLPTTALLKLTQILLFETKENQPGLGKKADQFKIDTTNKKLKRAVQKQQLLLYTAKQQLEKVQKRYDQALHLQTLCNYLIQQKPTDEDEVLWLELQLRLAAKKLQQYSLAEQAFLQWKVDCLQSAIEKGMAVLGTEN